MHPHEHPIQLTQLAIVVDYPDGTHEQLQCRYTAAGDGQPRFEVAEPSDRCVLDAKAFVALVEDAGAVCGYAGDRGALRWHIRPSALVAGDGTHLWLHPAVGRWGNATTACQATWWAPAGVDGLPVGIPAAPAQDARMQKLLYSVGAGEFRERMVAEQIHTVASVRALFADALEAEGMDDRITWSITRPTLPGRCVELSSLTSARPGQGDGSRALELLTVICDAEGVGLRLQADVLTGRGIADLPDASRERLIGWYGRHGFVAEDARRPDRMVRHALAPVVVRDLPPAAPRWTEEPALEVVP